MENIILCVGLSVWLRRHTFALPVVQPGGVCIIDIVGVFVRVSGPTERYRQTDRYKKDRQTETDRARQID